MSERQGDRVGPDPAGEPRAGAPLSEPAAPAGPRVRLLMRGESPIASIGLALAAILLCAMAATGWWTVRTQRVHMEAAAIEEARGVGALLWYTTEAMLARDELSALRRLVAEAGQNHQVVECRIVLPDGGVIADADPARINVHDLPDPWPGNMTGAAAASGPTEQMDGDHLMLRYPLHAPPRGEAELVVRAQIIRPASRLREAQAGMGVIGAGALLALLLVYRRSRSRLRAMGAIREALLAAERGESAAAALSVSAELGAEAAAWNRLLSDAERARQAITQQRALESLGGRRQNRGELDDACDAMPQGLVLVDRKMRVRYANGAAAAMLGTERDRLLGGDIRAAVTDQVVREALDAWESGRRRRRAVLESSRDGDGVEGEAEQAGGVLRWVIRPVRRGDSGAAMIVIEDVTQQRVADEAHHQFVAQATHELRTPLTNIRLYLETALEEGESDAAVRAKCLNVINSETRRLERIVSDLLSTAEMEAGSLRISRDDVRLDELLPQFQADYEAQAKEKNIELSFNLPPKLPVIQADRDMLALALHNLIGNALKYTPADGMIGVSVEVDAGALNVEVADTGYGIAEDEQERVFDKFYRAHDKRVRDVTGSGLGLALAREVARLHGGDITVRSKVDQGSTFTLSIPIQGEGS